MAPNTEKSPANYVDLSIYVNGERLSPETSTPQRSARALQLDEPFFLRNAKEQDFTEVELRLHRLRDFTVVRQLGEGRSGKVEEVVDERSGKRMARKRFFVPDFRGKRAVAQINQIKGEILSLKRLSHPHIVRFVSCHQQKENAKHLNVYLLMQPVGEHDLQTFMALVDTLEPAVFDKSWIKQWFMCLLSALAYMHSQHVHHDDIKPSNIICRRGRVYFTDFSSSRRVESGEETSTTSPAIATRLFAAPESFRSDENEPLSHGSKTDVYALGLVFVELLVVLGSGTIAAFRNEMFQDYTHFMRQYHRVTHKFRSALEGGWDTESRRFYERFCEPMLQKRRNGRPSARYLFAKLKQQPRAIGVMRCCCRIQNERQSWTENESEVDVEDGTNEKDTGSENTGTSDKLTKAESDSDSDWVYLKFRDLF